MTISSGSRREFLRVALGAAAVGFLPGCRPTTTGPAEESGVFEPGQPLPWRNWAGNQSCTPAARLAPESEDEVVSLLAKGAGPVRPVGAGHSFSALVPTDGSLLATDLLSGELSPPSGQVIEVGSGTRLHQLGPLLQARGLALENLPDIDYQTIAGAIATSTHGTGAGLGSLSSLVEGLTLATPSGELIACDRERHPELFAAARCSLGALGVVTRVKLRCRDAFRMAERSRFTDLEDALDDAPRRYRAQDRFELLAFPHATIALTIDFQEDDGRTEPAGEDEQDADALRDVYAWLGAVPGIGDWLYDTVFWNVVDFEELRRTGHSWEVLTHPRIARFREMEYTVPAEAGPACLREILAAIRKRQIPVVYPIEYRYVKQDEVWLSMFNDRDGCAISLHQYADEDHRPYFDAIEPIFWKYEGRPHWGKLHSLDASRLGALYPQLRGFREMRRELDPEGRLLNDHLRHVMGA